MTRASGRTIDADIAARLAERLDNLRRQQQGHRPHPTLVHRLETDIDPIDTLAWVSFQSDTHRAYWQNRENHRSFGAVGAADVVTAHRAGGLPEMIDRVAAVLHDSNDGIRYFGGFRFDMDRSESALDSLWDEFAAARLVLPRFEVVSSEDRCYLACNILDRELTDSTAADIVRVAGRLRFEHKGPEVESSSAATRRDVPARDNWRRLVEQVLASLDMK